MNDNVEMAKKIRDETPTVLGNPVGSERDEFRYQLTLAGNAPTLEESINHVSSAIAAGVKMIKRLEMGKEDYDVPEFPEDLARETGKKCWSEYIFYEYNRIKPPDITFTPEMSNDYQNSTTICCDEIKGLINDNNLSRLLDTIDKHVLHKRHGKIWGLLMLICFVLYDCTTWDKDYNNTSETPAEMRERFMGQGCL